MARAGRARECAAYHAPLPRGSSGQARYVQVYVHVDWVCLGLGVGLSMCVCVWCTHAHPPPHCPSRLSPDEAEEAKLSGEGGGVDGASGEAAAGEAEGGAGAGAGAGGDTVPAKSWYAATTPKSRRTRRDPPLSSTSASKSNLHNLDTSTLLSMEKVGLVPSLLAACNVRRCCMLAAVR